MSQFYSQITDMRLWNHEEANAWASLAVLSDSGQTLDNADLAQLRVNYHLARRLAHTVALNTARQLAISDSLGITYPEPSEAQNEARCGTTSVPYKF